MLTIVARRLPFSNCLIFALWCWITRGGYLILRRSHHGWWPHVLWCAALRDATIEHYVPLAYSQHYAASHKLLFRGYVSRVDQEGPHGQRHPHDPALHAAPDGGGAPSDHDGVEARL